MTELEWEREVLRRARDYRRDIERGYSEDPDGLRLLLAAKAPFMRYDIGDLGEMNAVYQAAEHILDGMIGNPTSEERRQLAMRIAMEAARYKPSERE